MLLRLPLTESSAKVRTGWPLDEEEDYDLPIWAGVVPVQRTVIEPRRESIPDPSTSTPSLPAYVERSTGAPTARRGRRRCEQRRTQTEGSTETMCGVVGLLLRDRSLEPRLGRCWSR